MNYKCIYKPGDITTHFARLGNRYFTANRDTSTGYDVIAGEIAKLCAERGGA